MLCARNIRHPLNGYDIGRFGREMCDLLHTPPGRHLNLWKFYGRGPEPPNRRLLLLPRDIRRRENNIRKRVSLFDRLFVYLASSAVKDASPCLIPLFGLRKILPCFSCQADWAIIRTREDVGDLGQCSFARHEK
jgi:hypothetical protein